MFLKMTDRSLEMLTAIPGKTKGEKLTNCWDRLQRHVNSIFDSEIASKNEEAVEHCPGIKQKLEKKAGI